MYYGNSFDRANGKLFFFDSQSPPSSRITFFIENKEENSLEYMQQITDKNILVDLKTKVICKPTIDTTYTDTYPIRITGECSEEDLLLKENNVKKDEFNQK